MEKQAPGIGKILAMVVFALSCLGLLLFLWLSFGGPTPLKPKGYRIEARFTEAPLLVTEANVRMAGLDVGKVKATRLDRSGATIAEIELDDAYAPIPSDTRAILRPKSLLGQTYVELSPGTRGAEPLPDGGRLPDANIAEAVDIDEIIRTFDRPTRRAFRGWVRELAKAIDHGRGEDLSDALGNLPQFVASGRDVLEVLDSEEPALHRLVRNTGIALGAVNERRGQLRELVVNANDFFGALDSRNDALARTIEVLPTFLDESRATVARLERFSVDTRPLVRDLQPVATELRPALREAGALGPDLETLFARLDPLIDEAPDNLPHASDFLEGVAPVFRSLHPYLQELNPILAFANYQQEQLADFLMNGAGSLNATLPSLPGEGPRHYLRQVGVINSRGLAVKQERPSYDRGNAYPAPNYMKRNRPLGMTEAFDCKPGGERPEPAAGEPPCFVQPPSLYDGNRFPRIERGEQDLVEKPSEYDGREPATP